MDARLTDEQEMVQESAREFIEANGGIDYARREMNGDESVINEVWDEMDSMGYTTLTVPVSHGGMGEGMVYLSALLEELDRFALPGPYPETVAFSVPLIDELGTSEQKTELFDAVVEQGHKMTFALHDSRNQRVPNAIEMGAARVEEGFVLTGTKTLVPYGSSVDSVVVAARTRDASDYHGISLFVVDTDKVDYTRLDSLDQTRPMYDLEFDEVVIPEDSLLGPLHGGGSALSRSVDRFNLSMCAMLLGGATRAIELSSEYGNDRHQYGQPIGRFQAVKHRLADMWVNKEHARSLIYYAAWAHDNDEQDATRAISMAKAFTGDKLHQVFTHDIWNHGAMGFTWDYDGHIYLKQAKAVQNFLGSPDNHLQRVADVREYSTKTLPEYPELTEPPHQ